MKIKCGTNFFHSTYGMCVVENYDDTSGMYIACRLHGLEIFYATEQQIYGGM